jgi:hypothetical protein
LRLFIHGLVRCANIILVTDGTAERGEEERRKIVARIAMRHFSLADVRYFWGNDTPFAASLSGHSEIEIAHDQSTS